jgi:ankyrin repeat protein
MTIRSRRTALFTFLILTGIAVSAGLWWRSRLHQYALDRQLIVATVINIDDEQAIALVNEGADPNTPFKPSPSPTLRQLLDYLLHHTPLPRNDSATSFQIVCGSGWRNADNLSSCRGPDSSQLVKVMLEHGANINASDPDGYTPLMWAVHDRLRPKTLDILLEHGANVNAMNESNESVLRVAMTYSISSLSKDNYPETVIAKLLAHGADPNLPDKQGQTTLQSAQRYYPQFAALLRRAGAKK